MEIGNYAVIFTSVLNDPAIEYHEMAEQMLELAKRQPGFLGFESARSEIGISVSYWESLEAIQHWKQQTQHLLAQERGRSEWYQHYAVKVCCIEKAYSFQQAE